MSGGSVGILDSNQPIVCGGSSPSRGFFKTCHIFETDAKEWKLFGNMATGRSHHAIARFPNGSLWITGGYNGYTLDSTEVISNNGDISPGISLPNKVNNHCILSLEDGRMLISGGFAQNKKVWFYDDQNGFTPGPDMLEKREGHACSTFKSALHQQREVALVAGGDYRDDVEVLDYQTEGSTWEKIKSLPRSGYYDSSSNYPTVKYFGARALTSPSGDGVIVQSNKHFFELQCDQNDCDWIQLDQELDTAVRHAVMSYLPEGYTC